MSLHFLPSFLCLPHAQFYWFICSQYCVSQSFNMHIQLNYILYINKPKYIYCHVPTVPVCESHRGQKDCLGYHCLTIKHIFPPSSQDPGPPGTPTLTTGLLHPYGHTLHLCTVHPSAIYFSSLPMKSFTEHSPT